MREDIEMGSQISMFDGETQFKITKPLTTCLMAIFGKMCDVDYKTKIEELTKNLTREQKDDRNRYNENYESN